ncbi:hypothetical protein PYCC9005_000044 [Savitreella phatthalungensis]
MTLDTFDIHHASGDRAKISLHGATVLSWKSFGHERLFLSDKAILDGSKAIRGGIPLVFPFFGPADKSGPYHGMPQHGFARISRWRRLQGDDSSTAVLQLTQDEIDPVYRSMFTTNFTLQYTVSLSEGSLTTELSFTNTGSSGGDSKTPVQALLHTYLRVGDIDKVQVQGLQGLTYTDKTKDGDAFTETSTALAIGDETDRVYQSASSPVSVAESGRTIIRLDRKNLPDVVIWNPWKDCYKMGDFAPADGYKQMLCVEAGNVSRWSNVAKDERFVIAQTLFADRLS